MKPSEVIKILDLCYQLADKPGKRIAVNIVGEMGIGKSELVKSWGREKGFTDIFDFRGAVNQPEDLAGYPRAMDMKMIWLPMEWLPTDPNAKLLLILEELNRSPSDVQQAIFQLLTENKIHTHEFPKFTMIVSCNNPSSKGYHVSVLDPAMVDRFFLCELEPDVEEWLTWMHKNGGDPRIISFIATQPDLLCKITNESDKKCPTPRSWKKLSDLLQVSGCTEDMLFKLAVGTVGKDAALAFLQFCDKEYKKPVTGKEILEHWREVKEKVCAQRNDEMAVTIKDLGAYLSSMNTRKINKTYVTNLASFLKAKEVKAEWKELIFEKIPVNMLIELSTDKELTADVQTILDKINKAQYK